MKKILLLVMGLMVPIVHAGESHYPQPQPSLQQSIKINTESESYAGALASSNSNATSGSASVHVDNDVAASSTVTGSSNTTANCWRYDSTSGSFIFAGLTKTLMIRDLVCTLDKPLNDEQKLALCLENSDYRKLRDIQHAANPNNASCAK